MTSITQESDDGDSISELEARIRHVGEVQVEMAAAERAVRCQSRDEEPDDHLIKALWLLANRHERELDHERDYECGESL